MTDLVTTMVMCALSAFAVAAINYRSQGKPGDWTRRNKR